MGEGAKRGKVTFSASALARAADMALRNGTTRDWKREFILHLKLFGACTFEGVFVGAFTAPCRAQPFKREAQRLKRLKTRAHEFFLASAGIAASSSRMSYSALR